MATTHIFQYGHKIFLDSNPDHISCIVNDHPVKVWPILFHAHRCQGFPALSSDAYSKLEGEEGKIPEQFKAVLPTGEKQPKSLHLKRCKQLTRIYNVLELTCHVTLLFKASYTEYRDMQSQFFPFSKNKNVSSAGYYFILKSCLITLEYRQKMSTIKAF